MAVAEPKGIEAAQPRTRYQPPYNVVLIDDQDHTYAYVVEMLHRVFGYAPVKAFMMACEVDAAGRCVVFTGDFERAELKRELIHGFGPDPRIPRCKGSMTAVLEPACSAT